MPDRTLRPEPFFLVGCGRSGTTLLQALIDGHPNIAIPPESHIYVRFGGIFQTYGDLAQQRNRLRLIAALLNDSFIRQWKLGVAAAEIDRRLPQQSFVGIVSTLFSVYAEAHGASRWGDKTPGHIRHLRDIRRDFPGAKLIHLVRDGRDVAEAMQRMIFYPVTALGVGRTWRNEVMHWPAFCAEAGTVGTLVLRYEDLVRSPRDAVGSVFRFIEEPFADTTSTYTDSPLVQTLDDQGPWHASLSKNISTGKIGIYRQKFTPREIEILEFVEGDALAFYGYETEHESPRAPSFGERAYAVVADRVIRWYRKLHHPRVFWQDLQFRCRVAWRLMLGGLRRRRVDMHAAGRD